MRGEWIETNVLFSLHLLELIDSVVCNWRNLNDGTGAGGDTGPQISALLTDGAGNGRALHLTLGVDDDTGVVCEIKE